MPPYAILRQILLLCFLKTYLSRLLNLNLLKLFLFFHEQLDELLKTGNKLFINLQIFGLWELLLFRKNCFSDQNSVCILLILCILIFELLIFLSEGCLEPFQIADSLLLMFEHLLIGAIFENFDGVSVSLNAVWQIRYMFIFFYFGTF